MRIRGLSLLVAAVLSPAPGQFAGPAQPLPALDPIAIDSYLREQVRARRLPGLAVAVIDGERVVLLRGYGSAGPGRPVTAQTQFYIGSCTKSFTALAALQLVSRSKLELDAPVQRYLPWFRVADDASSSQITVRHLLNQTSGLSEAGDPRPNDRHASLLESARALSSVRPNAAPGSRFQYYNQNYRALGALIECVSGQSYADYLRDHVLTPLAMSRTTADPARAPDLAQGHAWTFGFSLPRPQGVDRGALSSGYVVSTAEDLAHYVTALLNDGRYGGQGVADSAALAQLFALPPGVDGAGAKPPSSVVQLLGPSADVESGYAMGWLVMQAPSGRRVIFHGGSLERFQADVLLLPAEKRGCAMLVNSNGMLRPLFDPDPLWIGLAQLMVGARPASPPPARWRVVLFALVVSADLAIGLLRIWRLPRWRGKLARRAPALSWSLALLDAAVPAAFLVGFPLLLSSLARVHISWLGFLDAIPDVAAWFLVSATLSLTRGLAKIAILAGVWRDAH